MYLTPSCKVSHIQAWSSEDNRKIIDWSLDIISKFIISIGYYIVSNSSLPTIFFSTKLWVGGGGLSRGYCWGGSVWPCSDRHSPRVEKMQPLLSVQEGTVLGGARWGRGRSIAQHKKLNLVQLFLLQSQLYLKQHISTNAAGWYLWTKCPAWNNIEGAAFLSVRGFISLWQWNVTWDECGCHIAAKTEPDKKKCDEMASFWTAPTMLVHLTLSNEQNLFFPTTLNVLHAHPLQATWV